MASRRRRGFTFLEVLLVLGLLGVVMTGIYQLWHTSQVYARTLEGRITPLIAGQSALHTVTSEIRSARRLLFRYQVVGTSRASGSPKASAGRSASRPDRIRPRPRATERDRLATSSTGTIR